MRAFSAVHAAHMRKHTRPLLVGISAFVALGTLSGCSGGSSTEATVIVAARARALDPTTHRGQVPASARYMADMVSADGKKMTIGISVDGADIAAYACNGTDDEAWFFGNQTDGKVDIKSRFRDTLQAEFAGNEVTGEVTMNGVEYEFTANAVAGLAGMYTAVDEGVRASWVVRPDGSATGVQLRRFGLDLDQADLQQLRDDRFRAEVRNKRVLQQAQQIARLQNNTFESTIDGTRVTPVLVNGNFRF